jgi:hypothetical protein
MQSQSQSLYIIINFHFLTLYIIIIIIKNYTFSPQKTTYPETDYRASKA